MTTARLILGALVFPLAAVILAIICRLGSLSRTASAAVWAAFLMLVTALWMFWFSLLGMPWTGISIFVGDCTSVLLLAGTRRRTGRAQNDVPLVFSLLLVGVAAALPAYAAIYGRVTSADLLLFWGTKAIKFGDAAGLDTRFLSLPFAFLMHPDYPPLVPFVWASQAMVGGRFAWAYGLVSMPVALFFSGLALLGFSESRIGRREAVLFSVLTVSLGGFCMAFAECAGNAEPMLFFFEAIALGAVTFLPESPGKGWICALGLLGAIFSKVEGTAFSLCLLAVYAPRAIRDRGFRRTYLTMALTSGSLTIAWALFARINKLGEIYAGRAYGHFTFRKLDLVLKAMFDRASYDVGWLPWLIVGGVLVTNLRYSQREWVNPAAVGSAFFAFILFAHMHGDADPTIPIGWSATRLLLTPLLCCLVSSFAPPASNQTQGLTASA